MSDNSTYPDYPRDSGQPLHAKLLREISDISGFKSFRVHLGLQGRLGLKSAPQPKDDRQLLVHHRWVPQKPSARRAPNARAARGLRASSLSSAPYCRTLPCPGDRPPTDTVVARVPNTSVPSTRHRACPQTVGPPLMHTSQLVAPRRGATSGVDDDVQPVLKKLLRIDEPVTEHDAAFLDRYGFLSPSTPIIQAEALPPVSAPSTRRYLARTPPSKLPVPFDQCAPLPHSEQQPHPRSRDALVDRPQRTLYRNNRGPLDCSSRPWPHVRGCDEVTNAVDSDATTASHPNAGFGESSSGSRRLVIHPLAKGDVGYHPSQPRHPPADPPSHWNKERGAVYAMRSPYMPPRDTIVGASAPAYAPRYAAPPVLIPLRLPERPESTYNTLPPGDLTQPRQDAERRGLDEHSPSTSPTSCSSDIHRGTQYWDFSWPTDEDAPGSKALGRSATISSSHSTPTCGGFSPAPAATLSLVAPFVPPRGRVNAFTRVPRSLSVSEVPCFSSDSSLPPKPVDDDESWPEESTAFLFLPCFTTEGLPIASASPLQVDQRDPDSVPISRYSALDGALIMH